ncbi:hypothetical protein ACYU03_12105 [Pseudomonas sp. X10]
MSKAAKKTFYIAGAPMIAVGAAFAAVGASGQPAFGWTAAGLMIPGVALLIVGACRNRRRA